MAMLFFRRFANLRCDTAARLAGICLFWLMSVSAHIHAQPRPGNAFDSQRQQVTMAPQWVARAVEHVPLFQHSDLVISLGQQTHPLLQDFIRQFADQHGLRIGLLQGTCGVSAKRLRAKSVDIAAFCCPPGKTDRLPGLRFHTIAIAPLALITHADNAIDSLTFEQAQRVFTGDITHWSALPATADKPLALPASAIRPVVRLHCKKRPGHWRLLVDNEDLFSPHIREVGVIPDMIREVAQSPRAIGYETLYMLDHYPQYGNVKVLDIDGLSPSDKQAVLSGDYPLYRTFSLTSWAIDGESRARVDELIDAIGQFIEQHGERYHMVAASSLRRAGWTFDDDELVAGPEGKDLFTENHSHH